MPFYLPPLPYDLQALAPYISSITVKYHYEKHHAGYIKKLNELVKGTQYADKPLDAIVMTAKGTIFNNAAQVWNHNFYWQCLSPKGGGYPHGKLAQAIDKYFGSYAEFKITFKQKALDNFGSGWTWLVKDPNGALEIINTSNAGNPLTMGKKPLLTCDVWEHAYYLDYKNERGKYIDNFWHLVNWKFVAKNYD